MFTFTIILLCLGSSVAYYFLISSLWYLIPVWLIAGTITGLILFVLLLVILMPYFKFTKPNTRAKYYLVKHGSRFINLVCGIRITVQGKTNIPKKGKLTIYANHKSMVDPFMIVANMNRQVAFTPKISLYKIPIIANYMDYLGCLPIDRGDNRRTAKTMIKAIKNVEAGLAMLVFPEGGILSRAEDKMVGIKAGAYKIGMKAESDFLPVSVIGSSKIVTKKWWQRRRITIIFHPVIKYDDVKNITTQELGEKMFTIINQELDK